MLHDTLKFAGTLELVLRDSAGNIKESHTISNLVVNQGKAIIMQRLLGASTGMTHMGVGQGTSVPIATEVALQSPLGSRVGVTGIAASIFTPNDSARFQATFSTGVSGPITEAGLFSSATGTTLCCRAIFPVINKGSEDTLTIVWILTAGVGV